jgi:phenylalanyl-tRNA synthetase beta chain
MLVVANELGVNLEVQTGSDPSFHPGRCAELVLTKTSKVVGFAGELHPAVVEHWNLPKRSCAAEVDLSALLSAAATSATAPVFSNSPVAKEDLAFVVAEACPVAEVQACIQAAGGELLESIRLFDVYEGDQIPPGHKSLAFALRFRGEGQTLSPEALQNLRTQIITAVTEQVGGTLR